ncbi:MAG: hypothetical protein JWM89_1303 [Acidimicrobiales bacterium]|nr:hypothetical protein [Acidimicrobiales bacterium]
MIETQAWAAFVARLRAATEPEEQLALCAAFVSNEAGVISPILPAAPWLFIRRLDPTEEGAAERALENILAATDKVSAAGGLIQLTVVLDRTLARRRGVGAGDVEPFVWSYVGLDGTQNGLHLLSVPSSELSIERQDFLANVLVRHRVLQKGPGGLTWDLRSLASDQVRHRYDQIQALLAKDRLRVGAWPGGIDVEIDPDCHPCAVVGPLSGENEEELVADVLRGIEDARVDEVDILVLPELYLPAGRLHEIEAALDADPGHHPALTVVGLSHQSEGEERWVNEAVLLDHRGRVLDRYQKVNGVVVRSPEETIGECLAAGERIVLRQGPFGWIALSICLDLFAPITQTALLAAGPSLVLAPSLSPSTSPHQDAAKVASIRGVATLVANRPLGATEEAAPSFFCDSPGKPDLESVAAGWDWTPNRSYSTFVQVS